MFLDYGANKDSYKNLWANTSIRQRHLPESSIASRNMIERLTHGSRAKVLQADPALFARLGIHRASDFRGRPNTAPRAVVQRGG